MHCHFMFGINAPTGFETILDAVIKKLLAPYVTERIRTLVKEFGSSQTGCDSVLHECESIVTRVVAWNRSNVSSDIMTRTASRTTSV